MTPRSKHAAAAGRFEGGRRRRLIPQGLNGLVDVDPAPMIVVTPALGVPYQLRL